MKITFVIRYHDGASKFHGLNMYYGADSFGGMAEAVALTTHAIVNNEILTQTPSTKGFSLDFKESHEGSYIQKFILEFTDADAIRVVEYLRPAGFMELMTFHLASPLGLNPKIESDVAKRWFRSYMNDSETLLERLSRPLTRIHHPVSGQGYQVTLFKSRTPFLSFNERTLDYLSGSEVNDRAEELLMGVSRFNARTGTGRFIEDEQSDSISFSPLKAGLTRKAKSLLANSLKDLAEDRFTQVKVEVRRVMARDGRTKHLILQAVHEV
ncbi:MULTISPECIES: hypothetical protein [unclassified Pseudomonas]|uniref:DUF7946 domain-containing protein n=1 Tax=unclassified Pseudomonas TaxID=196821 RepID=UPI000A1FDCD0|nr:MULTISPECIES: hypothetical protein [unclassified Pseudomonas]